MKNMKKILCSFLIFILGLSVFAFDITKDGKANAVIELSENPSRAEIYAKDEFVKYINKISGATLQTVPDANTKNKIIIRKKAKAKDEDRISLKLENNTLYIEGNNDRGVIYAVYEFLEKYCNVRFFTKDTEQIPQNPNISTPENLNYTYVSPFKVRDTDFRNSNDDKLFYVKQRFNSREFEGDVIGGTIPLIGWCHTMGWLMPQEMYLKDHSNFYSFSNGTRKGGFDSQLCWTDREMQKELAKNVISTLDEYKKPKIISVSQNDNNALCECEKCQKAYKKYGAESGALLECVNYVAKEVRKKYPDVYVETLAYARTLKAPKNIKPEDNVIIRICNISCNFGDPLENRDGNGPFKPVWGAFDIRNNYNKVNSDFADNIEAWSRIAKNMFVWDYAANFSNYHIIHPNFHVLKTNINYFLKNHAIAVFEEGDRSNICATFNELKSYLISKLLWDPTLDDKALIKEFCQGVYKEGGEDIEKTVLALSDYTIKNKIFLPAYIYNNNWITNEFMSQCIKNIQSALKKTENSPHAHEKITGLYIDFLYGAYLKDDKDWEIIKKECSLPYKDKAEYKKLFDEYNISHGNPNINEHHLIIPEEITKELHKSEMVPEICKNLNSEDWFELDDRDFGLTTNDPIQTEDKTASEGTATLLKPDNIEWSMTCEMGGNFQKWREAGKQSADLYLVCKSVNRINDLGGIVTLGIYDNNEYISRFEKTLHITEINDYSYTTVYLGNWDFRTAKSAHFYFTPVYNPKCAEAVSIDRVIGILK